ncbi:MAG: HypC/HybG/HupF family hydrogenase formation chaperone [Ancalomicrobiaceae bacterium]|nr:HypC/HybG/HupF family hydrogenase formation chaperone [Ancalomicrobiaceae bacterium]
MCLGLPMTVIEGDAVSALCARGSDLRRVSMLLIGQQPAGTSVLVHIDSAVRVLEPEEARLISEAIDGLAAALEGRDFEHLFADLIDREPELPPHLRPTA